MPKRSSFRTLFGSQCVNGSPTLRKSARHLFYPSFPPFSEKCSWKTSLLVRSEMLGVIANTLTENHKSSSLKWENLPQAIQVQLFKEPKTFCRNFIAF